MFKKKRKKKRNETYLYSDRAAFLFMHFVLFKFNATQQ